MGHTTARPPRDRSHIAAVTTREELIYLLSRASELEHGAACLYLFAGHSLKSDVSEGGLTQAQAELVRSWKRRLAAVAVEEMLHLAQVTNLLTAIGGAPHFRRANFPMPASAFPFGIRLSLEPFSQQTIERFVCFEMPEPGILPPPREAEFDPIRVRIVERSAAPRPAGAAGAAGGATGGLEPFDIDFTTVGEFYHKIASGFETIPERELFIGPPEAQANARFVDLESELVTVADRRSARAAIEMIVEQGEAPTAAHPDAHFEIFDRIRLEYREAVKSSRASGAAFEPVRPVVSNPMTRFYDDTSGGTIIVDPLTHEVADAFNVAYDTMLLMLLRFFAHTEETETELAHLSRATLRMMTTVLRPLGEALTKMPVGGARHAGMTAGPGFGYTRDIHLLPHKRSACIFFGERLRQLATVVTGLGTAHAGGLPGEVEEAAAGLQALSEQFARTDRTWNRVAELAEFRAIEARQAQCIAPSLNGPYLVTNVDRLVNSKGERIDARPEMALCRCGGSANKPFCDGTHARIGFSSAKLPGRVPDRRDNYVGERITIHDNRGICQHSGICTEKLAPVFRLRQEPFVDPHGTEAEAIIETVRKCPSGALSYTVGGIENRDQDREPTITVSKDGPYRVTGRIALKDAAWAEGASTEHYALCRCGGSKNKPFCDGTHWTIKFKDERN